MKNTALSADLARWKPKTLRGWHAAASAIVWEWLGLPHLLGLDAPYDASDKLIRAELNGEAKS